MPNKSKFDISQYHSPVNTNFPIVCIGASAGGLDAIIEFLKFLPANNGMAFIYVQHQSPNHQSHLSEILSKTTEMKVQEMVDLDLIMPNNLYIFQQDKAIFIIDGLIKLIPRAASTNAITIDILFSSLATTQKERMIGIILSGSGSDGTLGMTAIKKEGGITFAQDDSAQFNSMPQAAISAGVVDFILPPSEMAVEIARISKHSQVQTGINSNQEDLIDNDDPDLQRILRLLTSSTNVDFKVYKMNTIKRRIIRRMLLHKMRTLEEYELFLSDNAFETDLLYQDLLINVTSFFRDSDACIYLKENLFPKLISQKKDDRPLRIWIAACASGEEAYTMGIILLELKEVLGFDTGIQLFATDLSAAAINKARIGLYSPQEVASVSPDRLSKFFTKVNTDYRINKEARELCVFAQHNILVDPPFSRIDFISCCNLFIYLNPIAQKKALSSFHYALNPNGFLMLSKSETIGSSNSLFADSSKKHKIFSRKEGYTTHKIPAFKQQIIPQTFTENIQPNKRSKIIPNNTESAIDAILISQFLPPTVVINYDMEILQFRGTTDLFLSHTSGKASFNILKMAKPDIAFELRNAISEVIKSKNKVVKPLVELKSADRMHIITIEAIPVNLEWTEPLIMILFIEHDQIDSKSYTDNGDNGNQAAKDRRIIKLEEEVLASRADSIALAKDQDAFNEELQSANEEIMSSNEELQTTNEELATSKEEIESTNEELTTTNQELQTRYEQLNESYEYPEAIISTIHDAMFILDKDLRVKSGNKIFYKNFGVREEETKGQLFFEIGAKQWDIPILRELLEAIIIKNVRYENFEIKHTFPNVGEKILSINASPLIHNKHKEKLILLAIADITELTHKAFKLKEKEKNEAELKASIEAYKLADEYIRKKIEEAKDELDIQNEKLKKSEERYHSMVSEVEDYAILYLNKEGIIENWNKGAEKIKGYKEEEIIGKFFGVFYTKEDQDRHLPAQLLLEAQAQGSTRNQGWRVRKDGSLFWGDILITALMDEDKNTVGFSKVTRDHTDRRIAEDKTKKANEHLIIKTNQLIEAQQLAHIGSWEWDVLANRIEWSEELFRIYDLDPKEFKADYDSFLKHVHPDDRAELDLLVQRSITEGKPYTLIHRITHHDGSHRTLSSTAKVFTDSHGNVIRIAGTSQDITKQKEYETELLESEERFFKIFNSNPVPMTLIATGTSKITYANNYFYSIFGYSSKEVIGFTSAEMKLLTFEENDRIIRSILDSIGDSRSTSYFRALSEDKKEEILNAYKITDLAKNFEVNYLHKNGTVFPALTSYETIKIKNQKYTITSYIDITQRKKAEEILKSQNKTLEKMNIELQSFAYISSHDLQEPLRKIQTFSSRILEKETDNLSEKGKYHFSQVQNAASRMQQLIHDLLEYSRTKSENLEFEETDLGEIIDEIKVDLKYQLKEKNAKVKKGKLCHAHIIPFQFRQLLVNLISNSLKFEKPDVPAVIKINSHIVSGDKLINNLELGEDFLSKVMADHMYCHMTFSDNGIGFEQEYSNKIFDVFQRLHGKEVYDGTGIGLAIVKRIVDNHHGSITANGVLGVGATFDIYFPT